MAKRNKIRITANDRAEYKKLSQNVRSKLKRTKKNFGVDLSNQFKPPSIDSFKSRKEFNEWKEKAKSFTNRGNMNYQFVKNDYGVVATKAEINKIKRDTKRAQKRAEKLIKEAMKLPFIQDGKVRGRVADRVKMMSKEEVAGISVPSDFDFDKITTRERLEDKKHFMEERASGEHYDRKAETLKENFITTLEKGFNSDVDDIVKILEKIPAKDFVELSIMFEEFDIRQYDSKGRGGINDEDRLEIMRGYLGDYLSSKIDMKLRNF